MKPVVIGIFATCLLAGLGSAALAAGPISGEVGADYWANDVKSSGVSMDAAAPGYRAELWLFKKYGLRAGKYESDPDNPGMASTDYMSLDVMWRAYAPSENNFLAVGVGWQDLELGSLGLNGDTSGARVAVEGRIGLGGLFYAYGQGAYLPSLDDLAGSGVTDLSGHQLEAGVSWKMAPFVSMRGGYRINSVDFTASGSDQEAQSDGFLLGLSARF